MPPYVSQAEHPFITQLVCTYADPTHVYFLLAPALGGEVLRQSVVSSRWVVLGQGWNCNIARDTVFL